MTYFNRTSNEAETLMKEVGLDNSALEEDTGRRRTRSAAKGIVYTPPPKRQRAPPGSGVCLLALVLRGQYTNLLHTRLPVTRWVKIKSKF